MESLGRLIGATPAFELEGGTVGKSVNVVTAGEDTEIDRNMVEEIHNPLVHLIRNAVDHGIEPPEVRVRAAQS